jgi:hypothetical protein
MTVIRRKVDNSNESYVDDIWHLDVCSVELAALSLIFEHA